MPPLTHDGKKSLMANKNTRYQTVLQATSVTGIGHYANLKTPRGPLGETIYPFAKKWVRARAVQSLQIAPLAPIRIWTSAESRPQKEQDPCDCFPSAAGSILSSNVDTIDRIIRRKVCLSPLAPSLSLHLSPANE
jgi:hypothetical protein